MIRNTIIIPCASTSPRIRPTSDFDQLARSFFLVASHAFVVSGLGVLYPKNSVDEGIDGVEYAKEDRIEL